jgi:putative sporulation protein YyaC
MERWTTVDEVGLVKELIKIRNVIGVKPVTFLCIGTDRSTGDSLGPLVGTGLIKAGFDRVIGSLESPCDANTLPNKMAELADILAAGEGVVIAVDAALGKRESVGKFQVTTGPLLPGASIGKKLPPAGDYGVAGIVNQSGVKKYAILQHTPLHRVMRMADTIVAAMHEAFRN